MAQAKEKMAALAEWHDEWQRKYLNTVTVDPEYSRNDPSQYAETIADMSASQEADDIYWERAFKILGIEPFQPE